jgi:hypothetical protein
LTQGFAGTTTAGITGLHTDVPKTITDLAAKRNSQVGAADQATGTFVIRITITLAFITGTVDMAEARVTMVATHTAAATAGRLTNVARLVAGLTSLTGISSCLTST